MLRMDVGWRRDEQRVHLLRGGDLLVGARTDKKLPRIQSRIAFRLLNLIETCMGSVELVLKQVGQRNDTSGAGVHQIRRVFRSAPTAAEQADGDGGIRVRAMHQGGLDEHCRGGGSRRTQERTAVDL